MRVCGKGMALVQSPLSNTLVLQTFKVLRIQFDVGLWSKPPNEIPKSRMRTVISLCSKAFARGRVRRRGRDAQWLKPGAINTYCL